MNISRRRTKVLLISAALTFVFSNAQFVAAQYDLIIENYQETERTVEVGIYKKDSIYEVTTFKVTNLQYPYSINNVLLAGKTYYGSVVSFLGKPLGYFNAGNVIIMQCAHGIDNDGNFTEGCKEESEGDTTLFVPYFNNGKYAEIYEPDGKKILTIDLSSKATCNENNRCDQPVEDNLNCSSDCRTGETTGGNSLRSSDYPEQEKEPEANAEVEGIPWWLARWKLMVATLLALVIAWWFLRGLL